MVLKLYPHLDACGGREVREERRLLPKMTSMRAEAALYLIAAIGNLFMAMLVVFRARKARGALAVAFLSLALFTWDLGLGFYWHMGEAKIGRAHV